MFNIRSTKLNKILGIAIKYIFRTLESSKIDTIGE